MGEFGNDIPWNLGEIWPETGETYGKIREFSNSLGKLGNNTCNLCNLAIRHQGIDRL